MTEFTPEQLNNPANVNRIIAVVKGEIDCLKVRSLEEVC